MFGHIFLFEVRYRFKRMSTYVYFAIWFFMAFFSVSVRQFGPGSFGGKVFVNSPFSIVQVIATLMIFGLVVISAIFGTSIYRDFEQDTYQLLFTTPMRKRDYLGGRLLGSLVITVLIFSGMVFGLMAGTFMPWADHARLMAIVPWFHVQPFLLFVVVEILFTGALFFLVGALTRNIVFVYLQGVVFFALYLITFVLITVNPESLNSTWPALVDPMGLVTVDKITRYWTVVEKNTQTIPVAGVMLWNRLIWSGVGLLSVIAVFRFFPFSAETLVAGRARRAKVDDDLVRDWEVPVPAPILGPARVAAPVQQLWRLTRLHIGSVVREVPFAAIVLIGMLFVAIDGWHAGELFDTPVYPVTYIMAGLVRDEFFLFLLIITTLYAGELVWKERTLKYDQIHDALPAPGWANFCSQFLALTFVQVLLLLVLVATGVVLQALLGYYRFQLDIYFKELFVIALPSLMQFTVLALLLQSLVPNKFVGHALVIGYFIAEQVMGRYGLEDTMYQFSEIPDYIYSDMNGYGHFVRPAFWFTLYWSACAGVLATLAVLFGRRGTDLTWRSRFKEASARWRFPMTAIGLLCLAAFGGIGAYVYHNTHRLNPYEDSEAGRIRQANFEKTYKKYEDLPQPKITAIDANVEIFPERRSFSATATFTLVNKSDQPIADIHMTVPERNLKRVNFDRAFTTTLSDTNLGYSVYHLTAPLAPHESIHLTFAVEHMSRGFRIHGEKPELAFNGTFFDSTYFPAIGYQRAAELSDEDERRDQGLAPQADMPLPEDERARGRTLFTSDADWISFKATVSTSFDQIAVAPGYLTREWTAGGRRFFAYDMGDARMANFYAFVSGRYVVRRDRWNDVTIEVYYDPQHEYNVSRMIASTKAALEYYTRNFGPYQFRQFRILEFPRYRTFAQSFPNTVPFSEGIGFIAHGTKDDDVDVPFYVTGHELAHQWWGHQVVGDFAQGSNMLSETLAQYSALMVMEKEVGAGNIRLYLKHELDRYLRGRGAERRKEPPIMLVQNEPYVWYQKGSLVMYAMKDYLGEARLNAAIRGYLERVRFQEAPYTSSVEFVEALRAASPDDMKYLITDLFETITLFDNRATEAAWRPTGDGKYAVTIRVSSRKFRADGLGKETEIPVNDLIDIGVFTGTGKDQRALFLEKRRITQSDMTFEVVVGEAPTRAGIDPYNKLIDRSPEDNTVAVAKAS